MDFLSTNKIYFDNTNCNSTILKLFTSCVLAHAGLVIRKMCMHCHVNLTINKDEIKVEEENYLQYSHSISTKNNQMMTIKFI